MDIAYPCQIGKTGNIPAFLFRNPGINGPFVFAFDGPEKIDAPCVTVFFPEMELILKVPDNQKIYVSEGMEEILGDIWIENSYSNWELPGHTWIMSDDQLKKYEKLSE